MTIRHIVIRPDQITSIECRTWYSQAPEGFIWVNVKGHGILVYVSDNPRYIRHKACLLWDGLKQAEMLQCNLRITLTDESLHTVNITNEEVTNETSQQS